MEGPAEINSVFWNEEKKSWDYSTVRVDEYFGFTECQQCREPMSHNVKTGGQFRTVYVKCRCAERK